MRFDGTDRRQHLRATIASGTPLTGGTQGQISEILIAPDGDRAVIQAESNIYLVAAVPLTLSAANSAVPPVESFRVPGLFG